ncbi:MAG: PD-(D/E)XK nuclease family protein [Gammaproteobacteria bacterium]|nr:PD-(D/E)XK nuclease family protein [Gammaproteobacteria bacterium]
MVLKTTDEFIGYLREAQPPATVIAASSWLARRLQEAFAADARARGQAVWETPDILPWRAFVSREAERMRALDHYRMVGLTPPQERLLWRQIVAGREQHWLCGDDRLADLAAGAWSLLGDYGLPLPPAGEDHESGLFRELAQTFLRRLHQGRQEDAARDPQRLAEAYRQGHVAAPGTLIWYGFLALTPAQRMIHDAVGGRGACVRIWPLPAASRVDSAQIFPSFQDECVAALQWAATRLRERPHGRFALIVPDLATHRRLLSRLAADIVPPKAWPAAAESVRDAPVVAAALRLIASCCGPIPAGDAAFLVQSPFVQGYEAERFVRFDGAYRLFAQSGPLDINGLARFLADARVLHLAKIAYDVAALRRRWPVKAMPSIWAQAFFGVIKAGGWQLAGGMGQDRAQALDDALATLATLDAIASPLSPQEAYALLCDELDDANTAPSGGPLEFLSPAGVAGGGFDGMWFMNMTDEAWPRIAAPHPLLPWRWQRQHQLPGTLATDQVKEAEVLSAALFGSAAETHASCCASADGEIKRPGVILQRLGPVAAPALPFVSRAQVLYGKGVPRESVGEVRVLAKHPGPYGVGVLDAQARCPFRAFAQYRLEAYAFEPARPGLAPATRGRILHKSLEYLFTAIPDQAALVARDARADQDAVEEAVDRALKGDAAAWHHLPRRFQALERRRYADLLREFLALERTRPPYTVRRLETEIALRIGGLALRGRIDRIDAVDGHGLVLIDYKTGRAPRLDVDGDPPQNPQLLVYALAVDEAVDALVYAVLQPAGCAYAGVGVGAVAPGVRAREDWHALQERWAGVFTGLAQAFVAGDVRVAPDAGACEYCGREALCRIGLGDDDAG